MRSRHFLLGELVQAQGEPLGQPAVVHEDDRRAVRAHELEQRGIDRRPDRVHAGLGAGRRQLAHVLERNDDLQVELFRNSRVDEVDRSRAGDEAADLLERALRGRQADALERLLDQTLEPFDRKREMRAALRARDRVHLVDDQRVDAAQDISRLRGQHQEERLGRRDENVRRVAQHRRALLLRRVAGANGDAER